MGASSKKKGQQRKAAAKKALSTDIGVTSGINSGSVGGINCKSLAKIRSGDNKTTKKLLSEFPERYFQMASVSLEDSGVLSVVLEFLNRCEDETFQQVLSSVGGDLKCPSVWIKILAKGCYNNYSEPSCKLQIAENIGPLVRCMVNDTERLFFKSNRLWKQGIVAFVNLVSNITQRQEKDGRVIENIQIVEALLQHEGLLRSIVQMGFWLEYRPDIVKELKSEGMHIAGIVTASRVLMVMLVNEMEGESRPQLLDIIGTTPVMNKEYDSTCMISSVAGVVRRLKLIEERQRKGIFDVTQRLVREADCVDKGVITEVIDLGTNYTSDYECALSVALLSLKCIVDKDNEPNDTRVAFAIRTGLIEMCLWFIERYCFPLFVVDKEFLDECDMCDIIEGIFQNVNKVSLHKKSSKAIESVKRSTNVMSCLINSEGTLYTAKNTKCKGLLDMVRSILSLNGSYCCRCNKALSKTEVKQCNGCGCMVYCSKACQKEDWLNGHSVTCNKSCTYGNIGQFQGRIIRKEAALEERAARKLEELEKNQTMIHLKLLLDHSETILTQARSLGTPLYDCVVEFDLRHCPHAITTYEYTDVYDTPEERKSFEETRSKENVACGYISSIFNGELDKETGEAPFLYMQRFFPHEWLTKQNK